MVLLIALLPACTTAELDKYDPPLPEQACDAQNPWLCPDGHACCTDAYPVCGGPDSTGYYCQEPWPNPDDPGHVLFGARKRIRAFPRLGQ